MTTDQNGTTEFFDVLAPMSQGLQITRTGPHEQRITNIVLGRAMLFIPQAVRVIEQVPMLIYYHGHHGPNTIEGYVDSKTERDFRPLLKDKKVLLVEPQGGPVSNFRRLSDPAGTSTLIWRAMQKAFERPPARPLPKPVPKPPSIIFAGFSGGGATMNKVALDKKTDYADRISEVWCFDSMYSKEGDKWVAWANETKKTLRVRVSKEEDSGAPRAQAEKVRAGKKAFNLDNIDIDGVIDTTHEKLPGMFIPQFL
jgi:hypothetical protein